MIRVEKERRAQELFDRAGFRPRHWEMTFERYKPCNKSQRAAKAYLEALEAIDHNIFIWGPVGVGKSHLAVSLGKKLIREKLVDLQFISAVNLLAEIKATFGKDYGEGVELVIRRFSSKPVLILDELGVEKETDWVRETFYAMIDNRYTAMLPTIVTSNLEPGELAEKIGDRLVSRLMEGAKVIEIGGHDYRLKEGK
jgi:DNA replication protein DnaC